MTIQLKPGYVYLAKPNQNFRQVPLRSDAKIVCMGTLISKIHDYLRFDAVDDSISSRRFKDGNTYILNLREAWEGDFHWIVEVGRASEIKSLADFNEKLRQIHMPALDVPEFGGL